MGWLVRVQQLLHGRHDVSAAERRRALRRLHRQRMRELRRSDPDAWREHP